MAEERKATLFMDGGSQAVVLEPLAKAKWPEGFWRRLEKLGPVTADFEALEPLIRISQR